MHGKVFLLDSIFAGIDETNIYGRMDFAEQIAEGGFEIVVNLESWAESSSRPRRALRLNVEVRGTKISVWKISDNGDSLPISNDTAVVLGRNFEFKLPLAFLYAVPRESSTSEASPAATRLRLRFSIWQKRLPVDALPVEGWMELQLLPEEELIALAH